MICIAGAWARANDCCFIRPGPKDALVFLAENTGDRWYSPMVRGRLFDTAKLAMEAVDEVLRDLGWTWDDAAEPTPEAEAEPRNLSDWFESALLHASESIKEQRPRIIAGIEDFAGRLQHCEKGTCLCPATRYASYRNKGNVVAFQPSCDRHGTAPEMAHPQADLVRSVEQTLQRLGHEPWWLVARDAEGTK